jgi:hypothetical protein
MPGALLDHGDLVDGLRELIARAHQAGIRGARVYIVGGAALRLAHFERDATMDIDARIHGIEELQPIIDDIGRARGWEPDWLNDNAAQFIPGYGAKVDWSPVYDGEAISIWVAPADVLLAMKLKAMEGRRGRDELDVARLMAANNITTVEGAEDLLESFFPGDALNDCAHARLQEIIAAGPPELREPPTFDLGG